jgi:hypothetical protein
MLYLSFVAMATVCMLGSTSQHSITLGLENDVRPAGSANLPSDHAKRAYPEVGVIGGLFGAFRRAVGRIFGYAE